MEFETMEQITLALTDYFEYYNQKRIHQSLAYQTPASWYICKRNKA